LGDNAFQDCFRRFKELADRKKTIYDEDIIALVDEEVATASNRLQVISLNTHTSSDGTSVADLTMAIDDEECKTLVYGSGPMDAAFNAVKKLIGFSPKLVLFQIHAITQGTDAQAECTVRLEEDGRTVNGQGAHEDTVTAAARAYTAAANKLLVKREKHPLGSLAS